MPLVKENSQLYEVIKVGTISGQTVSVSDGSGSLTVDGKAYRHTEVITRPSNTTAYTAGDVIGNASTAIFTLANIGPSGGHVLIQSAGICFSDSSVPAGMGAFRMHFYSSSPAASTDNSAFDLISADHGKYLGYIELPAPQDFGSTLYTQVDYPGRLVKLASGSTSLFLELETRGAYTPASASTLDIRVNTLEAGL